MKIYLKPELEIVFADITCANDTWLSKDTDFGDIENWD